MDNKEVSKPPKAPATSPREDLWVRARMCAGDINAAVHDKRLAVLKHHLAKMTQLIEEFG